MRRYESYKDSGVEWLGEVPSHWEISSLRKILLSVSEKNRPDLPLLSITRELGVIERDTEDQDSNHNFIPDDLSNYKILKKGQFGMNKMKAWQGSYGVSDFTGIVSPAYYIFDFIKSINPQFFHWAIRSKIYVSFFGSASDGVRIGQWDLSKSRMKSIPFIIPSNDEQQKIAQFLDDKTAKIDQAVDLAEKQIALLKEHKQILIQNAVTRGLNPDVPLKDSGVKWIGQVPEHWESFRFKRVVEKVKDGTHGTHSRTEQGYPLLSAKNIFNNGIQITDNESLISEYDFKLITSNGFPRKNDLLVTCVGSIGRCCIYPFEEPIAFQRSVAFLRLNKKAFPGFYRYFIESNCYQEQLKTNTKLSIQGGVYLGTLIDLYVCFPPLSEQQTITIYLDTQTAKIDQAIALKTAHIEKMKEYKSVLINDMVTGKVRVSV